MSVLGAGGVVGREVVDQFICGASKHLKENGCILLMQSTMSDVDKALLGFGENGLIGDTVARHALPFFEAIVLVKAER